MDASSDDDSGSESENPDELGDQLAGPAINSFPFEDVEEAETRISVSASVREADDGEARRRVTAQVAEADEGEASQGETAQVEEANERETSRGGTAQVEEADEGETSSEDTEEGEADRDESDAELSDVEEKGYCDFRSRENIEMNLELACVNSKKIKKLYRNTERVSKILLCNFI